MKDFYGIRHTSGASRTSLATGFTAELTQWKSQLPAFLDSTKVEPALLAPVFQRQSQMLNLAFCHALILVHRPFLLDNFASLKKKRSPADEATLSSIRQCGEAAMTITESVEQMSEGNQRYVGFWASTVPIRDDSHFSNIERKRSSCNMWHSALW